VENAPQFNPQSGELTVDFFTSEMVRDKTGRVILFPQQAQCNARWRPTYDIKELCANKLQENRQSRRR